MRILLFGSPGVGKGTQAKILSEKLNIPHISTGEILRQAVKDQTEVGKKIQANMHSGGLISDEIMIGIIRDILTSEKCADGFILDGFPRTKIQAKELDALFIEFNLKNIKIITIIAPEEEIIKRLSSRLACRHCKNIFNSEELTNKTDCPNCGKENSLFQRKDDNEDVVKHRIEIFKSETEPVLDYYKGKREIIFINGNDTVENVTEKITAKLSFDKVKN